MLTERQSDGVAVAALGRRAGRAVGDGRHVDVVVAARLVPVENNGREGRVAQLVDALLLPRPHVAGRLDVAVVHVEVADDALRVRVPRDREVLHRRILRRLSQSSWWVGSWNSELILCRVVRK